MFLKLNTLKMNVDIKTPPYSMLLSLSFFLSFFLSSFLSLLCVLLLIGLVTNGHWALMTNLTSLDLSGYTLYDYGCIPSLCFFHLTNLKYLKLGKIKCTPQCYLEKLVNLRELDITGGGAQRRYSRQDLEKYFGQNLSLLNSLKSSNDSLFLLLIINVLLEYSLSSMSLLVCIRTCNFVGSIIIVET